MRIEVRGGGGVFGMEPLGGVEGGDRDLDRCGKVWVCVERLRRRGGRPGSGEVWGSVGVCGEVEASRGATGIWGGFIEPRQWRYPHRLPGWSPAGGVIPTAYLAGPRQGGGKRRRHGLEDRLLGGRGRYRRLRLWLWRRWRRGRPRCELEHLEGTEARGAPDVRRAAGETQPEGGEVCGGVWRCGEVWGDVGAAA